MRRVFGLVLLALLLAGCSGGGAPACDTSSGGFCLTTSDGWILQAYESNRAANRSILLVHGLAEDHASYVRLASELSALRWHVIVFDSRGHGASIHRSDGTERGIADFSDAEIADMKNDLEAFSQRLGKEPDMLVGASVGSSEALLHAAATQSALVLLSPGASFRGMDVADADVSHMGRAYFVASQEDAYSYQSAQTLAQNHGGPDDLKIWQGVGHGTNMLKSSDVRSDVLAWINRRA